MEREPYLKGELQEKPIKPHGYVAFVLLKFNDLHHAAKSDAPITLNGQTATWDDLIVGDQLCCGYSPSEYGLINVVSAVRSGGGS